jgi:hypothetical protein
MIRKVLLPIIFVMLGSVLGGFDRDGGIGKQPDRGAKEGSPRQERSQ